MPERRGPPEAGPSQSFNNLLERSSNFSVNCQQIWNYAIITDMRNWSVDEARLKKYPKKYKAWKLEQQLTYGLDEGETINRKELIKQWLTVKSRLDQRRQETLQFLLWS